MAGTNEYFLCGSDAGKQLDVDYIPEGSVVHAPEQVRLYTQLVRVAMTLRSGRTSSIVR
jgi:hypothetical protein